MKLNIIRFCPVYYPYFKHGGSVVADYELDKALVSQGHSVTVYTCKEKNFKKKKIITKNHKIFFFTCLGSILYGISFVALFHLIKILLKKKNVDLVWFGGVWNLFTILGPLICRFFSVKYIITPHGMLIPKLITRKSKIFKSIIIKLFLKKIFNKAFKIHFTVRKELNLSSKALKTKFKPIIFPLTFDLSKFDKKKKVKNLTKNNDKITLSFIGNIKKKKRIDLVFDALKLLPKNIKKKIRFQIIGTDSEKVFDYQRYTEEKIGVEICYYGPLFNSQLIKAYHSTDIFILCSMSENFGISVVEAAYSYCALLISKEVGVSEYFLPNSAVISKLDSKEISKKIIFLVDNPKIIKTYKIAARKTARQFNYIYLGKNYFYDLLK